jgi:Tfp pilus assembly protein PilF
VPAAAMTRAEADRRLAVALERHKRGDLKYAYDAYRQVLAQHPQHPTALHYLGLIAQQSGRSTEAVNLLRRSISIDATDPRAHNHLGQVLLSQSSVEEAVACFEAALRADPHHIDSLNNLANVVRSRDLKRAIGLYRRALDLNPNAPHATYNLANALRDDHGYEEAQVLYRRAIAAEPKHFHAHFNLGVLLEQSGRFSDAIAHYLEARKIHPEHLSSLARLIALREFEPDEALLREAHARVQAADAKDEERIKLHHSLGKYHERKERYDEAFAQFAGAKACVARRTKPFEVGRVAAYFDRLIETFPAEAFVDQATGSDSERPVFVLGMPRSGTTLTEQILASHSQVFGAGELQDIPGIVRGLKPGYPGAVRSLGREQLGALAQRYLSHLDAIAPAQAIRAVDKLPVNFTHIGLIVTLFPQARIIHCRRDPMDIGLSCFIELFELERDFTTRLEDFGEYFLQYERLMAHWQAVLPGRFLEQRYEQLIDDPQAHSRALVAHCGLEWEEACLTFHETDRTVTTPSRWQVRQPIYRGSLGRWKRYEKHMEPLRRLLESRGYDYTGRP